MSEETKKNIKEKMGYTLNQRIILCVGELNKNKNQMMAIDAMEGIVKENPNVILILAGNGPEKENLEQAIIEKKLDKNVKLIGYVTNLQEYQHISDIAISCSKREGLPLNIVEAMLSGTPVVATMNRGHRELIQDGVNGFIIEINDNQELKNRILNLLDDLKEYEKIREMAQKKAKKYGYINVKKELHKIYYKE